MKILVTGGAGFIGSHLTRSLLEKGHQVFVIDNESTGTREAVSGQAQYQKGDVTQPSDLDAFFSERPQAVCHIAGQVSMIRSFSHPQLDLRTNVEGTLNVIGKCIEYRVPRLLYASSMTVYGETSALPISEDTACSPSSYYGITKHAAERYVHSTAQRSDLDFDFHVTSFRMFSVYGPGQALDNPYQGVLGIFLGNLLRGEPICIFGDGEQTRDFIYIGDVVAAWLKALEEPAAHGRIFNLGSGEQLSINELAERVLESFGMARADYEVVHAPARPGEQRHVLAETARLREALHWRPRCDFRAGLAETVKWAKEQCKQLQRRC